MTETKNQRDFLFIRNARLVLIAQPFVRQTLAQYHRAAKHKTVLSKKFLPWKKNSTNQISICCILRVTGVQQLSAYPEDHVEIWLVILFLSGQKCHANFVSWTNSIAWAVNKKKINCVFHIQRAYRMARLSSYGPVAFVQAASPVRPLVLTCIYITLWLPINKRSKKRSSPELTFSNVSPL